MSHNNPSSEEAAATIESGSAVLGIELGSTRVKATLIGEGYQPLAAGSAGWENKLKDGVWTYDEADIWSKLSECYADLTEDVKKQYGVTLTSMAAGGFSGMMHGYIALDREGNLLVPFRTWRNNITGQAASELAELFQYPIPQRWSIAHLYQAILNGEEHLPRVAHITTLAGYVHWKLTGERKLGTCEASGMFPVDPDTNDYDADMVAAFDKHIAGYGFPWKLKEILPAVVPAGEMAGTLSEDGAGLLDPSGTLKPGIPLCPPEGDAGTGMVATNSVRQRTGNVSAGTSVFAMIVLERKLKRLHHEIDLVLTPDGSLVGMAHSNNCTSDFDAWVALFGQAAKALGVEASEGDLYAALMPLALKGDPDAGGLLNYGYVSGEHVTGFSEGRPLFVRNADGNFTLENFIRAQLFGALGAMRTGLNILTENEGVRVDEIRGHGGFFKTAEVGQKIMAAATNSRVSLLETAGEGGAWGMALLAAYAARKERSSALPDFLDGVFADSPVTAVEPDPQDVQGFQTFFERYTAGLEIERAAVANLR